MNTEDKVTSPELSKALKEAGALQESDYVWCDNVLCNQFCGECAKRRPEDCPSALDCTEQLERLPDFIHGTHMLTLRKWVRHGKEDVTFYQAFYMGSNMDILLGKMMQEKTPAETLGKLLKWCLENEFGKKGKKS